MVAVYKSAEAAIRQPVSCQWWVSAVGHYRSVTSDCFGKLHSVPDRCERRAAHSAWPQVEVNPSATDAVVGSVKAPVRVADADVGGWRRGALRSGEQSLAFDAGEKLGGSDFEF